MTPQTTAPDRPALDRAGSRIDHLNLSVPDLAAAVAFYEPVLLVIGIAKMLEIPAERRTGFPAMTGFGLAGVKPYFWLVDEGTVGSNVHLAFTVDARSDVDAFHAAALAAGAEPLHAPGVHRQYHDDYYGGFVRDPHGINLEAVCHAPPA